MIDSDSLYFPVSISCTIGQNHEALIWCLDHVTHENWIVDYINSDSPTGLWNIQYRFKNEDDAVMFKLRYG